MFRQIVEELRKRIEKIDQRPEDFPNQNRELRLKATIDAVMESDVLLMEGSDGSVEETDYLTSMIALKWAEKAHCSRSRELLKYWISAKQGV